MRWRPCTTFSLVGLILGSSGEPQAQDLIVNGSFEQPDIPAGSFSLPSSIPGWSLQYGTFEIQDHVAGAPSRGSQHLELDAVGQTAILQTIATESSEVYSLTFDFSPRPGVADNRLRVEWNGQVIVNLSASGVGLSNTSWTRHRFQVMGIDGFSMLRFANLDTPDRLGTYLDAVRLVPVGDSPTNPILPDPSPPCRQICTLAAFVPVVCSSFCGVPPRRWYDPPLAYGYRFEMAGGSLFTAIMDFPPGFSRPFQVVVDDVVLPGTFGPGDSVDFTRLALPSFEESSSTGLIAAKPVPRAGVRSFEIIGIAPLVDPTRPDVFPVKLDFNTPSADFVMIGLTHPLSPDVVEVSATMGGTVQFCLDAGSEHAGSKVLLLGSLNGTSPGFRFGSEVIPLQADTFLRLSMQDAERVGISGSPGLLDAEGRAQVTWSLPPGTTALAGRALNFAFVALGVNARGGSPNRVRSLPVPVEFVSNAVGIGIMP